MGLISEIWDDVTEIGSATVDFVGEVGKATVGFVGEVVSDTIDAVPDIAEAAKNDLTEKVVKKIDAGMDFVGDKLMESADYLADKLDGRILQPGDVICVSRMCNLYKHFGIYIGDDKVIHYAKGGSGIKGTIKEEKLVVFLDESDSLLTCVFPDTYGDPRICRAYKPEDYKGGAPFRYKSIPATATFIRKIMREHEYHIYSPEETIARAKQCLGIGGYNLLGNNCEHFALWCKTGISESHQVEMLTDCLENISMPAMLPLPTPKLPLP